MKFWEKLILIIFSVVVLCMSIIMIVYKIGIIGSTEIKSLYDFLVSGQVGLIVLIINLVLIALAVKNIFFSTQVNNERTDGILLENESEMNLERNRRIDIRFVIGKPEIKIFDSIGDA